MSHCCCDDLVGGGWGVQQLSLWCAAAKLALLLPWTSGPGAVHDGTCCLYSKQTKHGSLATIAAQLTNCMHQHTAANTAFAAASVAAAVGRQFLPAAGLVGWVVPAQSNHSTEPWACPPMRALGALCCTAPASLSHPPPLHPFGCVPPIDALCTLLPWVHSAAPRLTPSRLFL